MRTKFNQNQFFLRPGYIVIYYQQYEIAPYATGIPEFSIPIPANQMTARK
ncbi:MAG: RsiV family protein [Enterocloster sp.]